MVKSGNVKEFQNYLGYHIFLGVSFRIVMLHITTCTLLELVQISKKTNDHYTDNQLFIKESND